jgi:16S rRNA processing protein RimM
VTPTTRFDDLVVVGRMIRPQGRHGEVLTEPLSDRQGRFTSLKRVFVEGAGGGSREAQVTSAWPHKGRWVLKLAGVDSIDAAEGYRGLRLALPEEELGPLPEGTFYHHQIRGLAVEDESGTPLGRVDDVWETGAALVLVVHHGGKERLIPFAEPFIREVRLGEGRLVVRLLETVDAAN